MIMGFEALYAGHDSVKDVWSGKVAHWSLKGLIVKSTDDNDWSPLFLSSLTKYIIKYDMITIKNTYKIKCVD